MKKLALLMFGMVLACAVGSNAYALPIFSGSDNGGTGSATMDISASGNTLTVVLNNTSPTTLDSGSGVNSPGITAFGFDFDEGITCGDSLPWDLTDKDGTSIAGSYWQLTIDGNTDGIKLNYIPNTLVGVHGALYNPDIVSGAAPSPFFTTATLTIDCSGLVNIADLHNPTVRMQNVGIGGEGSLKLTPVPEPATIVLFGTGLIGLAGLGRKKLFKQS